MRILAPAKVNLYLRVLHQRPSDGFHELETLFERVDLADELEFDPSSKSLTLSCTNSNLPVNDQNIVIRAARMLQSTLKINRTAAIKLTKRIPVAAGLGGGSSDAAATLVALNQCWDLKLSQGQLRVLAGRLGSDVPFFITSDGPYAIGRGRGDDCVTVAASAQLSHVLVVPDVSLTAKEVYQGLAQARLGPQDSSLTESAPSINMLVHALLNGSLSELAKGLWNDLEPEAIRRCPISAQIRSMLMEQQCLGALVSGSGPAVLGLCRDDAQALKVRDTLRSNAPSAWRIEAVKTAPRNSILSHLAKHG